MQTLILPGFSLNNKNWLEEVAAKCETEGIVRPVSWDHWHDEAQEFIAKEKGWLISRHSKGDKMNIIAKSIGTLVAAYVIDAIPEQINKVVLNGIPLKDINQEEKNFITDAINRLPAEKVLVIQNESDPHGSFDDVQKIVPENVALVKKPANDHEYFYSEDFNSFLQS